MAKFFLYGLSRATKDFGFWSTSVPISVIRSTRNLPSKSSAGESCKRCGPDRWQNWCGWRKSWAFLSQRTSRFTLRCN